MKSMTMIIKFSTEFKHFIKHILYRHINKADTVKTLKKIKIMVHIAVLLVVSHK